MDDAALERFADLAVGFGANVQPGQIVAVECEPGKEYLVRAIAAGAYRHGARFVDVIVVRSARQARPDRAREPPGRSNSCPRGTAERLLALGDWQAAYVGLSGPSAPALLSDLDPALVGKDRLPMLKEATKVIDDRTMNWTVVPCPTPAWAELVFPGLDPAGALERLEREVLHVLRLDEEDPIAAWRARADTLAASAARLTERRFDALHLAGPGTDLEIGLLPRSRWEAARFETVDGLEHMPNLPTEEVFTTPDPERTSGTVTSTKPLVLIDGTVVRDLVVRFEAGPGGRDLRLAGWPDAADADRDRRGRGPARRVRARRPRGPDRPPGHRLLRHAAR